MFNGKYLVVWLCKMLGSNENRKCFKMKMISFPCNINENIFGHLCGIPASGKAIYLYIYDFSSQFGRENQTFQTNDSFLKPLRISPINYNLFTKMESIWIAKMLKFGTNTPNKLNKLNIHCISSYIHGQWARILNNNT